MALQSRAENTGTPSAKTVTGLDHVSFQVGGRADLDEWTDRLAGLGVTHSAVVESSNGSVLSFRDPDGIAVEVFFFFRGPSWTPAATLRTRPARMIVTVLAEAGYCPSASTSLGLRGR